MASYEIALMLRELLSKSSPGRLLLLANTKRYRSPQVASDAIAEAVRLRSIDPSSAQVCADAAVQIARHFGGDLLSRALAESGNILRIRDHFRRARQTLAEALSYAAERPTFFRVWSYRASLEEAVRAFECAASCLRAARGYATKPIEIGRLEAQRGVMALYQGRPQEAVRILRQARQLVKEDDRLFLVVLLNHANALAEAGWSDHARAVMEEAIPLRHLAGEMDQLKARWIDGRISATAGQNYAACVALDEVRGRYLKGGFHYESALVSLELMLCLTRAGRFAEAEELGRSSLSVLEALGIGPGAIEARLLGEAVTSLAEAKVVAALLSLRAWAPPDAEAA